VSTGRTREERAHSIRTVLIASAASAIAAVVTSFFWRSGTPIAAAVTPVIVAVLSELLYRPTTKITERVTSEGFALSRKQSSGTQARPSEARPSEARPEQPGKTGTSEPPRPATEPLPPRSSPAEPTLNQGGGRPARGKIHPRFVLVTALVAFVLAAAIITLPELLGGESIGSRDQKTTLFGGGGGSGDGEGDKRDVQDPGKPRTQPDETTTDTSGDSGSDEPKPDQSPKEPPAAAPKPDQQQGAPQTQTDTGSTSTTPR